jgi:hypothetical protein
MHVLVGYLGPRSLKQLCRTCHALARFCSNFFDSDRYPCALVAGVLSHLTRKLTAGWAVFSGETPPAHRAALVLATMSGSSEDTGRWSRREMLFCLYPSAFHLSDWALAPYALEWCARNEQQILGTGSHVRHELLALLHPKALEQLAAYAAEDRWGMAALATTSVIGARSVLASGVFEGEDAESQRSAIDAVTAVAESQSRLLMGDALKRGKFVFGLAVVAAINSPVDQCPLSKAPGLWASLGASLPGRRTVYTTADSAWCDMAGFGTGGEESVRNPQRLLEQSSHGTQAADARIASTSLSGPYRLGGPYPPAPLPLVLPPAPPPPLPPLSPVRTPDVRSGEEDPDESASEPESE